MSNTIEDAGVQENPWGVLIPYRYALSLRIGPRKELKSCVKPRIFIENPNPCTIAIVPGSVAITYRTSHR
jgi:hypothetical protein